MNYFLLLFLFVFLNSNSQELSQNNSNDIISKFEKYDFENKGKKIRTLLNENNDALIINFYNGKYISIVDNKVKCFTVCKDSIINIIKLNTSDVISCKRLIDTLISIDPEKIINETDKNGIRTIVEDGDTYEISVYKKDRFLKLYSYSPENYMDESFNYAEYRKTFLNSHQNLMKFFYDKEFERVKSLDTIYLFVERGKNFQFIVDENKPKNKRQENYFFTFNCSHGDFINLNLSSYKEPKNVFYKNKSFLKTNSEKILHPEFLQKFGNCDLNELINSNKRKVFIIDKDEIKGKKIKIKEFKGGTYCF
jgi:hypothetical protein